LQAAIKNAQANNVHIIGQGVMRADGAKFFIVPSQSVEGMCHVVKLTGAGLACDCYYSSQRGKVCAHRAATYLHLKAQAEAAKKPAPKAQPAPAPSMAARAARALPYTDDKPFSIYKN